jgi:hypothetical protein
LELPVPAESVRCRVAVTDDGPVLVHEHDEYGAGDPDRMHARLYAEMMTELRLCTDYGEYLDAAPAAALAEVNFMSVCGLHRRLRGALIGQLAAAELTSSPASGRMVHAMRRLGCGPASIEFYTEHIEADAVHEQLVRHGVITPLLAAEPELASDVVFGMQAANRLADQSFQPAPEPMGPGPTHATQTPPRRPPLASRFCGYHRSRPPEPPRLHRGNLRPGSAGPA